MFLSHLHSGRRRRVRLSYPAAVVELALALVPVCGVAAVAEAADIPKSAIYRWRAERNEAAAVSIGDVLDRCTGLPPCYAGLIELTRHSQSTHDANNVRQKVVKDVQCESLATRTKRRERTSVAVSADAICRLHVAKACIEERYAQPLDCTALAREAGMSRSYFIRLFGELFGTTPHQYLVATRIRNAGWLLDNTAESIDVIAAGVGFRSGANLGRAFKRIAGCNISQVHAFTGDSKRPG